MTKKEIVSQFVYEFEKYLQDNEYVIKYNVKRSGVGSESTYVSFKMFGTLVNIRISCHEQTSRDKNTYYLDLNPRYNTIGYLVK